MAKLLSNLIFGNIAKNKFSRYTAASMLFVYDERSKPRENARVSDEAARLLSRAALEWLLAIPLNGDLAHRLPTR